jgi:hypothetical protein
LTLTLKLIKITQNQSLIHAYKRLISKVNELLDLKNLGQAYHPSRIYRDCPGLELTAPVADEILTGKLSVPVCEFSNKREKIPEKNLIPKLN